MNRDLEEVVRTYATEDHRALSDLLLKKSRDNLIAILTDLLTNYFNDKNSSSLREYVIVAMCGYEPLSGKIGYNGFRQNALTGASEHCEAKPVNIDGESAAKTPRKLDGGGNFTDFTWARLKKYKKANPEIITGGFVDGRLLYILRFPFNTPGFIPRLEKQLRKKLPDGDVSGDYVRSATFNFRHYCENKNLRVQFVNMRELQKQKRHFSAAFFAFLEKAEGENNR